jgi:hypothetical protein
MTRRLCLTGFFFLLASAGALAQDPVVTTHADPPPAEIADPIKGLLAAGGSRVAVGAKTLDFWWVKALPLAPAPAEVDWSSVEEGALVGAVRVSATYSDIRGKTIKPGVYTLRYGLQPADGNHLGVSPYREFLLISPAASDQSPAALGHDGAVNVSKQTTGVSHPASWSLDPPLAADAPLSIRKNDAGQKGVVFEVSVSRGGKDAGRLKFGLILVGSIQS